MPTLAPCDQLDERHFLLAVRRVADSLQYGMDRSPFLGAGVEFVQARPYQAGDPVKYIDWRVTARTGRLHVREYEPPKRMPVYLLLDTSASMCVTSRQRSKYSWAVPLAGGLALAALARLSPVGLMGCGTRQLHIRPSFSRPVVLQWLAQLRHYRTDEQTTVGTALRALAPAVESRCVMIVLSDLHDPDGVPALQVAAQRHDCLVLQLQDPAEHGRIGGGIFRAREAETGHAFVAHGRRRWLDGSAGQRALRKSGIDCLVLRTDEHFVPRLREFLRRRDYLGRGAR
jgi:uncharacterized protein (DUF58 family)